MRTDDQTLRQLLKASTETMLLMDTEGTIVALNEVAARRLGRSEDELIGVNGYDILPPDVAKARRARIEEAIRSGKRYRFEDEREGIIFDNSICPVSDANGRITHIAVFARDITERERTEEKLQQSKERFRRLIEHAGDAIFVHNMEGRILEVNRQAWASLGYTRVELLELNIADVDPEVIAEQHRKRFWEELTPEQPVVTFEGTHTRKDGTIFPVEVRLGLLEAGPETTMIGLARDITERKRTQQALQSALLRSQTILETSMDGFYTVLPDGSIADCNAAFCEIVGYSCDQLLSMTIADLEATETAEETARHLQKVMQAGSDRFETAHQRNDGTIVDLEISTTVVELPGESFFVSYARDITERKQMAEELNAFRQHLERLVEERTAQLERVNRELAEQIAERKRLQAKLIQASKMSALGTMAGGIAHEVRNPLSIISSCNQLLQEHPDSQEVHQQCIEKIATACQRASLIIENLLTFAAPSKEQTQPVDLNAVLNNAIVLLSHSMDQQGITLEKNCGPDLPSIMGNQALLQQVFINLMLNAIDAMPEGGSLQVGTRMTEQGEVAIEFTDSGRGISPEHLPKIFDPFFTTKSVGEGVGLGLSISYSIIQQHKGTIAVRSQPGQGSTFTVQLLTVAE